MCDFRPGSPQPLISNSYATGDITVTADGDGWSRGPIDGNDSPFLGTGGLIGAVGHADIVDSYTTGPVDNPDIRIDIAVGGLVGAMHTGTITNRYTTGLVKNYTGRLRIGGLIGSHMASPTHPQPFAVADSYWNTETTEITRSPDGGIGKTTAELQTPTAPEVIYADWDPSVWDFGTESQYPVLKRTPGGVNAQRP